MKPPLDPVSGFFDGFTSIWTGILTFFGVGIVAHGIGYLSAYTVAGDPFSFGFDFTNIAALPLSFMWQVLQAFLLGPGLIYVLALGICFFLICFSEFTPVYSVSSFFLIQIWATFFLQRELANNRISFFTPVYSWSNWGYLFAGIFSLIPIGLFIWAIWTRNSQE